MSSKAGAYVAVVAGGIMTYSAFTHKRIIDVLLMRSSTLPTTSNTTSPSGASSQADTGTFGGGTPLRQAVVNAATQALYEPDGTYQYAEGADARPYPPHLYGPPTPVKLDCSSFVTLCYKQGGAPDPNGLGYSGLGYTGILLAKGVSTKTPQPGDLAFWSNPDHVGLYIGQGFVIEFGAPTHPVETAIEVEDGYHSQFLGYRSYLPIK